MADHEQRCRVQRPLQHQITIRLFPDVLRHLDREFANRRQATEALNDTTDGSDPVRRLLAQVYLAATVRRALAEIAEGWTDADTAGEYRGQRSANPIGIAILSLFGAISIFGIAYGIKFVAELIGGWL